MPSSPTPVLRPFTFDEYHMFFKHYVQDPLMDPKAYVYSKEQTDCNYRYDEMRRDHYKVLGIFLDDDPIGSLQLKNIDPVKSTCELGIILRDNSFKNKGYGTLAVQKALEMAFRELNLNEVTAETKSINHVMQHVLEKTGFVLYEKDPHVYPDGTDRLCYHILSRP